MKPLTKEQLSARRLEAEAGLPVAGSKRGMLMDICGMCGDRIRVPFFDEEHVQFCTGCRPPPSPNTGLCDRQRSALGKTTS